MKTFKLLVLFVSLVAAPSLADSVDETTDADSDGTVRVSNVSGSVEVEGWDRNEVRVRGELGSRVEELIFERDGDEVLIKVEIPRKGGSGTSADLQIQVPMNSSIEINTVSADIDVEGVRGEQELEGVSADIETEAFGADVEAGSVSGDIIITGSGEVMRTSVGTVSGDIDTENLAGEFRGESVSGDVSTVDGRFERGFLNTVNGDLDFYAELFGDRRLDVESVNGTVDVRLQGDISARYDIETFNGSIRNCFGPESKRTSRYAPGRELKFTEGGGDGRVTIQTLNGSIRLCN